MRLSREAIQRMVGDRVGGGGGAGGGGGISMDDIQGMGFATEQWVNEKYLSIDFFNRLFQAYDSEATPNQVLPNDLESTITNIKAMFGFWTEQFVSALGYGPSGGGGGDTLTEPLASINNASLGMPTAAGQVITWNGSEWIFDIPQGGSGGGAGTVTSITAGTGLSGGTITTMGTIAISSTYQTRIAHGETAYGWGNHADAGYLTSSDLPELSISNGVITIGSNTITPVTQVAMSVPTGFTISGSPVTKSGTLALGIASGYSLPTTAKQSQWDTAYSERHTHSNKSVLDGITQTKVDKWDNDYVTLATGQTISGTKTFSTGPILNNATPIRVRDTDGTVRSAFELDQNNIFAIGYGVRNLTGSSTHLYGNSYIRFNLNGSVSTKVTPNGLVIGNDGNETTDTTHYLQIGGGKLCWDNTNKALYVQQADGTAAHFYATGGVSALGMSVGGTPSMNALTLQNLTVNGTATIASLTVRNTISSLTVDDLDVSNNLYMNGCDISMDGGNINNCGTLGADSIETGTLLVGSGSEVKKIQWDGTYLQVQIGTTTYKFRPDATA